ncbi:MAG TPA: OmpA family protein [Longimicrobiales bacterium]|nr:OmpA family protein [Longimicrobiales bacterium]
MTRRNSRGRGLAAALGLATVAAACSTVSPEEMDTTLASLRTEMIEEMEQRDQQVSQQLGNRINTVEGRVSQLNSDLQQMESDFEVAIQQLEDAIRFDVPVYFAFDDATVQAEGQEVLERFGRVAQEYYPNALITVEGFTDPSGPAEYNMRLGQRRADAVAGYLTASAGITQDRVRSVSYGENTQRLVQPQGFGPGQQGWENRRVVLVIDHNGQAPTMPAITGDDSEGSDN